MEKILHQHQFEALEVIRNNEANLGRIVIPTGGGKTLIESLVLRDRLNKKRGGKIHLVIAPRIVLVNQLMNNFREEIGQDHLAIAFHSGRVEEDYSRIKWDQKSTTNVNVVSEQFERAKRMKKDLVVFSTYASLHKLMQFSFETVIADESHFCVTEGFFEPIRDITSKLKLFFTATERHIGYDTGRGLNNESVFGKLLYQVSPKVLADRGIIVLPLLHVMEASSNNSLSTVVDEVIHLAKAQYSLRNPLMSVSKILFAMNGTTDVEEIAKQYMKIRTALPTHDVFTITSKGGNKVNGVSYSREEWFMLLRECDNAIICHYDILAEGIDIDGITGVCILRNLKQSKLLQTIGRGVRIFKANPELKKNCLVSVPVINGDDESYRFASDVIALMRSGGFEINAEMMTFTGLDGLGIAEETGLDDAYGNGQAKSMAQSMLENVTHKLELEEELKKVDLNDVKTLESFI